MRLTEPGQRTKVNSLLTVQEDGMLSCDEMSLPRGRKKGKDGDPHVL